MARFQHPLDSISVAAPCRANWDDMLGTDRARHCGQCSLNVYNLSGMTRNEAEDLINRTDGRLCVRFFRRADGTIITQNCPVGLAAAKVRVKKWATGVLAAVLSFFSGVGIFAAFGQGPENESVLQGEVIEIPEEPQPPQHVMGTMLLPARRETVGRIAIHPSLQAQK
jgi:hypothetical protein